MKLFEYIVYVVFEYFDKRDPKLSKSRTISFMTLLEATFMIPLFVIFNGLTHIFESPDIPNPNMKYYIGVPLVIILMILNTILLKKKLKSEGQDQLKKKYSNKKLISVWLIFILPFIFTFVVPIIFGALNGTLRIVEP